MNHLLEISDLCFSYGANRVLKNLSLALDSGEILGIIGENGAGKSTLVKSILSIVKPSSGNIEMHSTACAIHQNLNLARDLPVYANFFLGREKKNRFGLLDIKGMAEKARGALLGIGADINPHCATASLTPAQMQMVEIARALDIDAGILILDEPSALLNKDETKRLFEIMQRLKNSGKAMIYISHKLDEIREICDRFAVLRDGALVGGGKPAELSPGEMAEMMVGRPLGDIYPEKMGGLEEEAFAFSSPDIGSLRVMKGEILGISGLADSGLFDVGEYLAGFKTSPDSFVTVNGAKATLKSREDGKKLGIGFLCPDRLASGIWRDFPICENIASEALSSLSHHGAIIKRELQELAEEYKREFSIRAQSVNDAAGTLSGGNQQKVAIAKVLADSPSVVILNEPTQGVDVGARQEIYRTISSLAEKGLAIILISSDMQELIGLGNRIMVVADSKICAELKGNAITEQNIIRAATKTA